MPNGGSIYIYANNGGFGFCSDIQWEASTNNVQPMGLVQKQGMVQSMDAFVIVIL